MGKKRATAVSGDVAFDAYYAALFGERWPALRAALSEPPSHAVRLNPSREGLIERLAQALERPPVAMAYDRTCYALDRVVAGFASDEAWFLDPASVRVAALLDVMPGQRVLDLCAAPGGKGLALADRLVGEDGALDGELTLNELSDGRRGRLRRAVNGWLPGVAAAAVRVTGHDGSRWGLVAPASYDRVLLDAPCSSEAHVLADASALAQWTPARPRQLAMRQLALLCAAIDACASGGRVVYATCALAGVENDGVVGRALAKRRDVVVRETIGDDDLRLQGGEATGFGWRWLPDVSDEGPMAVAVLLKL